MTNQIVFGFFVLYDDDDEWMAMRPSTRNQVRLQLKYNVATDCPFYFILFLFYSLLLIDSSHSLF